MATFKISVQKQRTDGLWPVYIRVTHNRKSAFIKTSKMVDNKGLVKSTKEIKDPFVRKHCDIIITDYLERLNKVDITFWGVHDIVRFLEEGTSDICFSDYARRYKDDLYNNGQQRNAKNYELALQHMERFAGTTKVMFSQMTSTFINKWINSLITTSRAKEMYPVCMRQVFRQALLEYNDYDKGIIHITTNPWLKVKIPKADTPDKRAISMQDCRAFFAAPIPESDRKYPLSELGRDVAMMVLCLAGINTADIYNLEKARFKDGIIAYNRAKTRKVRADDAYFEIRVPGMLMPIINKYLDKTDSPFLFDFHQRLSGIDSFNANVNIGIRQICDKVLNLPKENWYCVYTFRHTWSTVAQNECGATLGDVDFALNHASKTKLARTYVKIDYSPAWELNEKVVEKIFFTEEKSNERKPKVDEQFERFSFKQLIKGTLYFKGRIINKVEDVGFNNVEQVISKLMKELPEDIPSRSLVQIRIENVDKQQTQDYTRMVK